MSLPVMAQAQERAWEWQGEVHPFLWVLGVVGVGVVILMLAVWALLSIAPLILGIIGAVLGVRWLARVADRSRSDPALAILRERYARREIGKDEFETRMRTLTEEET